MNNFKNKMEKYSISYTISKAEENRFYKRECEMVSKKKVSSSVMLLIGLFMIIFSSQVVCAACYNCNIGDHERCTSIKYVSNDSNTHNIKCCDGSTLFGSKISHNKVYDWKNSYTAGQCWRYKCTQCSWRSSWKEHDIIELSRVDATCTNEGSITYACSRDKTSHKYTTTLTKLGHDFNTTTGICSRCGLINESSRKCTNTKS